MPRLAVAGGRTPPGGIRFQPRVRFNPPLESASFVVPGLFAVILLAFPPLLTVPGLALFAGSFAFFRRRLASSTT